MTSAHDERETLHVSVLIPAHADRVETEIYKASRISLLDANPRCWICSRTAEESGEPLQTHHYPVERSLARMVDWERFADMAQHGVFGPGPAGFDWEHFDTSDPYTFVDDMRVNGLVLCRAHHIGADEGIHYLPHPLWIAQKFALPGYKFSSKETIGYGT